LLTNKGSFKTLKKTWAQNPLKNLDDGWIKEANWHWNFGREEKKK
jgi:hypothetical protein